MRYLNVIGSQVRKLRYGRGWTQQQLAIRLQRCGWDVSREIVAQIEGRRHGVQDLQLLYLAEVFGASLPELFPKINVRNRDITEVMKSRL